MMCPLDMARRMEKIHEELCVLQGELYDFKYDCGGRASLDSEAIEVQKIMDRMSALEAKLREFDRDYRSRVRCFRCGWTTPWSSRKPPRRRGPR